MRRRAASSLPDLARDLRVEVVGDGDGGLVGLGLEFAVMLVKTVMFLESELAGIIFSLSLLSVLRNGYIFIMNYIGFMVFMGCE